MTVLFDGFESPHTKDTLDALADISGSIESFTARETLWPERINARNGTRHLSDERFLARAELDAETELEKELCTRLDGALEMLWSSRVVFIFIERAEEAVKELDRRIAELDKERDELTEKVQGFESESLDGGGVKSAALASIDKVINAALKRNRKTVNLSDLMRARWPQ
jgi:hypothetical protein